MFDHCTCCRLLQKGHQIVASSKFTTKIFQQAGKRLFSKIIFLKLFVFGWLFFCFQSTLRNVFLNYSIFRNFVFCLADDYGLFWSTRSYTVRCKMKTEYWMLFRKKDPLKMYILFYTATMQPTINLSRYINKK